MTRRRTGSFTAAGGKWPDWPWNLRSPRAGALVTDALPGEGQLSKLSQPPQPFRQLLIGDLARQVRGGRPTQTAPARQQVMHAEARQLQCGYLPLWLEGPELPKLADAEEQTPENGGASRVLRLL